MSLSPKIYLCESCEEPRCARCVPARKCHLCAAESLCPECLDAHLAEHEEEASREEGDEAKVRVVKRA